MNAQSIIPPNIDYSKISADPFSDKKSYVIGELCIQFNKLWKFTSPKDAGAWDESKVEETTIANEIALIKSGYSLVGSVAGNLTIPLPEDFSELLISVKIINSNNLFFVYNIPSILLDGNQKRFIEGSSSQSGTEKTCIVGIDSNNIYIENMYIDGSTDKTNTTLYVYKK